MTFQPPRAIYFDLDYCMYKTDSAFPTLDALFRAKVRELPGLRQHPEEEVIAFMWKHSYDVIIDHFKLKGAEAANFSEFYEDLPVPAEAVLYPDTWPKLELFRASGVRLFLVTKGAIRFQQKKIAHVGISHFFEEVHIVWKQGAQFKTKRAAFEDMTHRHGLEPLSICVIGDGEEEIRAGLALGHLTVQTVRPGVKDLPQAHHRIPTLHDLLPILGL